MGVRVTSKTYPEKVRVIKRKPNNVGHLSDDPAGD